MNPRESSILSNSSSQGKRCRILKSHKSNKARIGLSLRRIAFNISGIGLPLGGQLTGRGEGDEKKGAGELRKCVFLLSGAYRQRIHRRGDGLLLLRRRRKDN